MSEYVQKMSTRRAGRMARVLWATAALVGAVGAAQAAPLDLAALEAAARKEGALTYYTVQTAAVKCAWGPLSMTTENGTGRL